MNIPSLHLTFGQVAWSLNFGEFPPKHFLDQLNYLSKLGIPFKRESSGTGSGNWVTYGYEDLIECGVAMYGQNRGLRPKDMKLMLVDHREDYRKIFRQALESAPESALQAEWVKYKGKGWKGVEAEYDLFLRLHNRYSETPGKIEMVTRDTPGVSPFDLVETYPDGNNKPLLPLTRLALQWTAWALEAPVLKPGPKSA